MEDKAYSKSENGKDKKSGKSLKSKVCGEVITPETMLMEYPGLEKIKGEYGDWSNFSNWNNWPHSR